MKVKREKNLLSFGAKLFFFISIFSFLAWGISRKILGEITFENQKRYLPTYQAENLYCDENFLNGASQSLCYIAKFSALSLNVAMASTGFVILFLLLYWNDKVSNKSIIVSQDELLLSQNERAHNKNSVDRQISQIRKALVVLKVGLIGSIVFCGALANIYLLENARYGIELIILLVIPLGFIFLIRFYRKKLIGLLKF